MKARQALIGVVVLIVAAAIVVVLVSGSSTPRPTTAKINETGADLTIKVNFPHAAIFTYQCVPSGASSGVVSCPRGKLDALLRVLNPELVNAAQTCAAQVYVGPEIAEVTGILRGAPIHTRLSRQNTCAAQYYDQMMTLIGQRAPTGA